jgi:hypothetical protein
MKEGQITSFPQVNQPPQTYLELLLTRALARYVQNLNQVVNAAAFVVVAVVEMSAERSEEHTHLSGGELR